MSLVLMLASLFPSPEPGKLFAFHLESEGGLTALHTPYQSAREGCGGSQHGAVEKESKIKREGWEDNGNTDSNICFKKKWPGSILPEMASRWPPILSLTREPVILSPSRWQMHTHSTGVSLATGDTALSEESSPPP